MIKNSTEAEVRILDIGPPVTARDIDSYRAYREIEDRSLMVRTLMTAWERQQEQERSLRRPYAWWLLIGMFSQVAVANIAFFLLAAGRLEADKWLAGLFIAGTFAEVVGLATIVTRHLFPALKFEPLSLLSHGS